ncbi:MAG TPA: TonB-dependent receptor [Nitrospiria bacterium]|nr:TonB-dependent receptor [Nitrospiria bacterium]
MQTLEEIEVTDSADNLVGSANAATEGTVTQQQIEDRPLLRTGELLETVPGVVITQHSGAGKANQYFLRGFNLDHGTDLATWVDGIPINFPSHAHGQGYTDLNFLIPELVTGIQYKKGTYYAEEGDFSAAGAVHIDYATSLKQDLAEATYGSFDYWRGLLAASHPVGAGQLLYAFEYEHEDGPWVHPDEYLKLNGVLRYTIGSAVDQWIITAMAYNGKWNATDQVPQAAIDQGLISRFEAEDPTDGGSSHRYSLSLQWQRVTDESITKANVYVLQYGLDLFSNFTYYLDDPVHGDQIEQLDQRVTSGVTASHFWTGALFGRDAETTVGLDLRNNNIYKLGLFHTEAQQYLSTTQFDRVIESSGAVYLDNGIKWTEHFRTSEGLRVDLYNFNVDADTPGDSGNKTAAIASPKLSLIFGPWAKTEYYFNIGTGFHSNDARGTTLPTDPVDPLVRAIGEEIGVRTALIPHLQSSLAVWNLHLDSELVFSGDSGTTEPSSPSRRTGIEWANYYTPTSWLTVDADAAYTWARYTEAVIGTTYNGAPVAGYHIPDAIESVVTAGVSIHDLYGVFGSLRMRYFGPRPLIEDNSVRSQSSTLFNGLIGYQWTDRVRATIEVFNILNAEVNDIEYFYESQSPGLPANYYRTIHPAEPRSFRGSITMTF